jgi:hypothetical protein
VLTIAEAWPEVSNGMGGFSAFQLPCLGLWVMSPSDNKKALPIFRKGLNFKVAMKRIELSTFALRKLTIQPLATIGNDERYLKTAT